MPIEYTLQRFLDEVYAPLKLRGKSANTKRLYNATLQAVRRTMGVEPTLEHMNDLWVSRYLEARAAYVSPRTGRKISVFTVEKERTQLCSLWRLACDRGVHPTGQRPTIAPEVLPERIPEAWDHTAMQRLFAAAQAARGWIGPLEMSALMPALISFVYDTGERITAVLETLRDDYHRPHVLVRAEARKGRKSDKLFELSPETCDLLDAIAVPGGPHLFPVPLGVRCRIWPAFGRIVEAAGIGRKNDRSAKWHKIRRSVASAYAAAGQDSTRLLGHSSKRITDKFYLDPRITGGPPAPCDVLRRLSPPEPPAAAS